jgi:D-ribose pyranose/furanose isomerase RbsD
MDIETVSFDQFKNKNTDQEGIVCMGCGGELSAWVDGVTDVINHECIAKGTPDELWSKIYKLTTSGGRIDLAFVSHNNLKDFNVGKMAIWRLHFGDCSWISDYIVNYKKQF